MPIVNLNSDFITNHLQCPPDKRRIEYVSQERTGLYVEVRSTSPGQGTYYLRYKNRDGKTAHQKIGRTTAVSLEDAKKEAVRLKAEITLGKYPGDDEVSAVALMTYSGFFAQHYLPYVQPRKRTWKKDEEYFRLRLKRVFGHLQLDQISRRMIVEFHTGLKEEGLAAATCNHYIKLLKHSLNLAVEWELLEKNPVTKIALFHEDNQVEHYLEPEELERLLKLLRTDKNRMVCQIVLWLLSTGARLNEAFQAKWVDIDIDRRVWRIPASNSKSKRVRAVPLNDSAIGVLAQLDTESEFEWLFVNRSTGKNFVTIQKVWQRLRNKAELSHLRIHDLRHNHASIMVNSGRSLYEVQRVLGHMNPKVTQRYSHLSTKTLQEASACVSKVLNGVGGD